MKDSLIQLFIFLYRLINIKYESFYLHFELLHLHYNYVYIVKKNFCINMSINQKNNII